MIYKYDNKIHKCVQNKITNLLTTKIMPIMKKQATTTIFEFNNYERNYVIMYRDNVTESYHVKKFTYEWNTDCEEWYKVLSRHEIFITYRGASIYFGELVKPYLNN